MIAHTITFAGYEIQVIDMELQWKPKDTPDFELENCIVCRSEIVSLFPYQDHLYISTLNGCLYQIQFPPMGNIHRQRFKIVKDNT